MNRKENNNKPNIPTHHGFGCVISSFLYLMMKQEEGCETMKKREESNNKPDILMHRGFAKHPLKPALCLVFSILMKQRRKVVRRWKGKGRKVKETTITAKQIPPSPTSKGSRILTRRIAMSAIAKARRELTSLLSRRSSIFTMVIKNYGKISCKTGSRFFRNYRFLKYTLIPIIVASMNYYVGYNFYTLIGHGRGKKKQLYHA